MSPNDVRRLENMDLIPTELGEMITTAMVISYHYAIGICTSEIK